MATNVSLDPVLIERALELSGERMKKAAATPKGNVVAKAGTYVADGTIKGQAFAGYIHTKSGRALVYEVVVNNVPINRCPGRPKRFQRPRHYLRHSVAGLLTRSAAVAGCICH